MTSTDHPAPEGELPWDRRADALPGLYRAGHHERVLELAYELLAEDPEDPAAHRFAALAHMNLGQKHEASRHLEQVFLRDPDDEDTHRVASAFYLHQGKYKKASQHAERWLALDPEDAHAHFAIARAAAARLRIAEARQHAGRARELSPEDPLIVAFDLHLRSQEHRSAEDVWRHLLEYQEALALEPNDATLHASLALLYLHDLGDPRMAEEHARQALITNPTNRENQELLFQSIAARHLLYPVLAIPSRGWKRVGGALYGLRHRPHYVIYVIMGIKFLFAAFLWLLVSTVIYWPACKIYEWLLISQIRAASGVSDFRLRAHAAFHRRPFALRFGLFLALNGLLWSALFAVVGASLGGGFTYIAVLTTIHLAYVVLRRSRARRRARVGRMRLTAARG